MRLAREIDWGFLDRRFARVCTPGPGQLACRPGWWGLFILKHMHNRPDEVLYALAPNCLNNAPHRFFTGDPLVSPEADLAVAETAELAAIGLQSPS